MSLSKESKEILVVAMANRKAAEEVAAAIDSSGSGPAASVAAIGATADLSAIAATYVDLAAARTSVNTLKSETEVRLDAVEAKIDQVIAALKAVGLML